MVEIAQHPIAEIGGQTGLGRADVLQEKWHTTKRTRGEVVMESIAAGVLEAGSDHRIERRVQRLDSSDRGIDQFDRRHVPVVHQLRLCHRVEPCKVVGYSRKP